MSETTEQKLPPGIVEWVDEDGYTNHGAEDSLAYRLHKEREEAAERAVAAEKSEADASASTAPAEQATATVPVADPASDRATATVPVVDSAADKTAKDSADKSAPSSAAGRGRAGGSTVG